MWEKRLKSFVAIYSQLTFTKSCHGKITLEEMPVTGEDPNNCLSIQSWQVTMNY